MQGRQSAISSCSRPVLSYNSAISMADEPKTKWDLSPLFSGDDDPRFPEKRREIESRTRDFAAKWKNREDWLQEPAALAEALKEYEDWHVSCAMGGDEGYYFSLRTAQDENNPALKAKFNQAEEFVNRIEAETQFFTLRLAKIPASRQKAFLDFPDLSSWRHFLERIFAEAAHVLGEAEEKIMMLKHAPAAGNWERMVSGFISKEERDALLEDGTSAKRTFSDLLTLLESRKPEVRDKAAEGINEILLKNSDTAEHEINSILQNKKIDDELRGFPRPDSARHLADDIDSAAVDALIGAVAEHFDISRRYYALRARLAGVPRLKYHERKVPYGAIAKKFPFPEAYALSRKVFADLDPFFAATLERFAERGQIDVYPAKNKQGGAFCAHFTSRQPTYILLNFADTLEEVTTLAHEMGHGINNELVRAAQNGLNFGTPTSTAEVASTFMEDFILEEILRTADEETRLAIMVMKLNDDVSAIFRQAACYKFETELHGNFRGKGYLSKKEIGELFQKHMSAYMGEAVEQSPGSENWWIYWSHIRNFFYVYSYVSGQLISRSLQAGVKADKSFMEKVKGFLSAGLSDSPRNVFLKLGIDIAEPAFWSRGVEATAKLLEDTEKLAKKLGKL